MRLRRVDCSGPGITRRRRGRGFEYLRTDTGEKVTDPATVQRVKSLAIPPAWEEVWICPHADGHLQAVGTDAAGRRQYRYHNEWRKRRDAEKFERMLAFARVLPRLREVCAQRLGGGDDPTRQRVLACGVRLLDQGFFRIGTEEYAEDNDSFGLATMRKEHVTVTDRLVVFDYPAKGGQRRVQSIVDPEVVSLVRRLKRRRGGGPELLAYRRGRTWVDVTSRDVNACIAELAGPGFSAKDFRTWNATVLAAVGVAVAGQTAMSKTARDRAVSRAVREVAHYLGNTPTVARNSYIDPRVFDRYRSGWSIAGVSSSSAAEPTSASRRPRGGWRRRCSISSATVWVPTIWSTPPPVDDRRRSRHRSVPVTDAPPVRCAWPGIADAAYARYHDEEWGRPRTDDRALYEKLCLEGFQAGLSWLTILRKRPRFREVFAGFDPAAVAAYDENDVERLLADPGIVRSRPKIEAAIANARATLAVVGELGSLAAFVWRYAPAPAPAPASLGDLPDRTAESAALARDLKRRGFRFVGPTTAYAFMQAMGLVNDHVADCHVRPAVEAEQTAVRAGLAS